MRNSPGWARIPTLQGAGRDAGGHLAEKQSAEQVMSTPKELTSLEKLYRCGLTSLSSESDMQAWVGATYVE
jgi:hypothetical protein